MAEKLKKKNRGTRALEQDSWWLLSAGKSTPVEPSRGTRTFEQADTLYPSEGHKLPNRRRRNRRADYNASGI